MSAKPSMLDAVKIQARVVIPIVKALERELGRERKAVPSPVHVTQVWIKRDAKWLQAAYVETPAGGK